MSGTGDYRKKGRESQRGAAEVIQRATLRLGSSTFQGSIKEAKKVLQSGNENKYILGYDGEQCVALTGN